MKISDLGNKIAFVEYKTYTKTYAFYSLKTFLEDKKGKGVISSYINMEECNRQIEEGRKKYSDGITRSYGSKANYQDVQLEYMKYRLIAGKAGKTNSSEEQLVELEANINKLESTKTTKVDKTAKTNSKKELSDKEVLQLRIEKAEAFLSDEALVSKLNEKVIEIKKEQLSKLKEQLKKI